MDSSCKRPRIRMNGIDQASAAPASRIFRVPRDAGGKDRHSKVITARGVRDRRVRLSVPTAIQFYDLQDRLGFDQPSKAVEWLIQAAASAIAQLPSLQSSFQNSNPELTQHSLHAHKVFDAGPMKSASYSSTSDTSKDSVDEDDGGRGRGPNLTTQNSFSELLTGPGPAHLQQQHLSFLEDHAAGGDCSLNFSIVSPGVAQGLNRGTLQSNSLSHLPHRRQQHLLPMLASAVEGPSMPFFFSPAAAPAGGGGSADCLLPGGFDGRLQLCSGEGSWHYSDLKGKGRG